MSSNPTITRSSGIGVGGGWIVGGGHTGLYESLDEATKAAAEALAAAYDCDVTIRFNSDRRSGGAWLKTHEQDRIGANSEIGIGTAIVDQRMIDARRKFDKIDGTNTADELVEGEIWFFAHIRDTSLTDLSLRDADDWNTRSVRTPSGYVRTPIDGYLHRRVESIEAAIELLKASAKPLANLEAATAEAEAFKAQHGIS